MTLSGIGKDGAPRTAPSLDLITREEYLQGLSEFDIRWRTTES